MKALALFTALSLGALFFGGTSSAANTHFSDSNVSQYDTNVQGSTAEPLDDDEKCSVTTAEEDVWRIKGNCNVSCYNGVATRGCRIEGKGPGKGDPDGRCKITHTLARNADVVGYCPKHEVRCTVSLTGVACKQQ